MRIIIVFILLAFGCQQTTVNGQQTLCTVPEPVEGTTLGASTSSATAYSRTVDCCPLSVDFYESQIRKADSLYKNYLPQSNFEEVKAAMEFFDSLRLSKTTDNRQRTTDFVHRIFPNKRQRTMCTVPEPVEGTISGASTSSATAYPRTVDCCPLSVDFICAKAHYYHAVGLTEKDDVVGACEHYLLALEIMEEDDLIKRHKDAKTQRRKVLKKQRNDEKTLCDSATLRLCDSNKEDYEKIRFVALIYNRLGRLFLNENYCELAITKYGKALKYVEIIDEKTFKANVLKELGNSYQLYNNSDSALYYYNESLKYNSSLPNKLDVEKSVAQILINKGERDSAYMLLKNNLHKINNDNVKFSYHFIIGDLYYHDEEYDSALYYLEESLENCIIIQRIAYMTKLSAIYDSLGDYEKRNYYNNISSKLFKDNINKEVDKSKLQVLYDNYKERKLEIEKSIAKARTRKQVIAIGLGVFVIVAILLILIRHRYKNHSAKLSEEIDAKEKYIKDNEFRYLLMKGKIKSKNDELLKKDKLIKSQQIEITDLKNSIEDKKDNLKEYCQSEICVKIFGCIDELSKSGKVMSELKPLSQEDFVLLLQSAKQHLSLFFKNISNRYPSLKKEDLYYLCLTIMNLNDKQIAALFGVTYHAIRIRRKKICTYLGVDIKENLHNHLMI